MIYAKSICGLMKDNSNFVAYPKIHQMAEASTRDRLSMPHRSLMGRATIRALWFLAVLAALEETRSLSPGDYITVGTVQSLSGGPFDTAHLARAYKLWSERTNRAGGILVGGERYLVDLRVEDDRNNRTLRGALYDGLARNAHAIAFLGSHVGATADLAAATRRHNLPAIACASDTDDNFDASLQPLLFGVSTSPELYPEMFLDAVYGQGVGRVALLYNAEANSTVAMCSAARARSQALGLDVVFDRGLTTPPGTATSEFLNTLLHDMLDAKPDALVACTLEPDSLALGSALLAARVIDGALPPTKLWKGSVPALVYCPDPLLQIFLPCKSKSAASAPAGRLMSSFFGRSRHDRSGSFSSLADQRARRHGSQHRESTRTGSHFLRSGTWLLVGSMQ